MKLARMLRPRPHNAYDDDGGHGGYGWRRGPGFEHDNERERLE
jgi:hypothetical protein